MLFDVHSCQSVDAREAFYENMCPKKIFKPCKIKERCVQTGKGISIDRKGRYMRGKLKIGMIVAMNCAGKWPNGTCCKSYRGIMEKIGFVGGGGCVMLR